MPSNAASEIIGSIDVGSFPNGAVWGIVGFDAGYVAWGTFGIDEDSDAFAVWHSAEGREWRKTFEAEQMAPCEGWTTRSSLEGFYAAASNGQQVVLIGSALDSPTRQPCDEAQPVSLTTRDGTGWLRSAPSRDGAANVVWPTSDGWLSAAGDGSIWRSSDGLSWRPAGALPTVSDESVTVAADADGTVLAATETRLLVSTDGQSWEPVLELAAHFQVTSISPPSPDASGWVVALNDFEGGRGRLIGSADLRKWHEFDTPDPETAWILPVGGGRLALTFWAGREVGCDPCPAPPPPVLLWSADAISWSPVPTSGNTLFPDAVITAPATGPAGLIGAGAHSSKGVLIVRIALEYGAGAAR